MKSLLAMTADEIRAFRESGLPIYFVTMAHPSDEGSRMLYSDVQDTTRGHVQGHVKAMRLKGWSPTGPIQCYTREKVTYDR